MELTEPVLVSADVSHIDPFELKGEDQVRWVQNRLLELGYTDGGPVDGSLNLKTQGTILDFRNRNQLELQPGIDPILISVLVQGPTIELPVSQVTAETKEIAEKVAAVKVTWYARFWAKLLAVPAGLITVFSAILDNFGNAVSALQPIRNYIEAELVKYMSPFTVTMMFTGAACAVALVLWRKAALAERALVEGYRQGTVKNDVDLAKDAV